MQIMLNGKTHDIEEPLAVADLLRSIDLDPREVAVEHNKKVLRKDMYGDTRLQEGDRIEIVRFVGGG